MTGPVPSGEVEENYDENMWNAFMTTVFAGLTTSLGGLIVLFYGSPTDKHLGHMLGLSVGVMLYISFMDLLPEAIENLGFFYANVWFFAGVFFFGLLVHTIPEPDISDIMKKSGKGDDSQGKNKKHRQQVVGAWLIMGLMSLHNAPEGVAVYLCSLRSPKLGFPLAMAIALHNIPEGMAVASPMYSATGSKYQAVKYTILSGLCEPLGALIFGVLFHNYINVHVIHVMLAGVAGMMVFMSTKELLPETFERIKDSMEATIVIMGGMFTIFLGMHFLHTYLPEEATHV